jgi:hypothetical protein
MEAAGASEMLVPMWIILCTEMEVCGAMLQTTGIFKIKLIILMLI